MSKKVLSWERRRVILEAFNLYTKQAPIDTHEAQEKAHRAWVVVQKHITEDEKNKLGLYMSEYSAYQALCEQIREDLAERLLNGE